MSKRAISGTDEMGAMYEALTARICGNCAHMRDGYYCNKLNKTFDGHEIDKGIVPCEGKHFLHYLEAQK